MVLYNKSLVQTIDLQFLHRRNAIGAYLIKHEKGAMLFETGPGSTIDTLVDSLEDLSLSPTDITHIFLSHIHLDHAGASGWLAEQGATIYVHPIGAPHMLNPEKLLSSAERIYGDKMDALWGKFTPVAPGRLIPVEDGETVCVGEYSVKALHTPGHAEHHIAWMVADHCFTGDVGGVRLPGPLYLRLPLVPPELNLEKWRNSLEKIKRTGLKYIIPTHYGIYNDPSEHLGLAVQVLDETEQWMEQIMPLDLPIEDLRDQYVQWSRRQAEGLGLAEDVIRTYEVANPTWLSADGLLRYWRKEHHP